jgi:hypothetical protein
LFFSVTFITEDVGIQCRVRLCWMNRVSGFYRRLSRLLGLHHHCRVWRNPGCSCIVTVSDGAIEKCIKVLRSRLTLGYCVVDCSILQAVGRILHTGHYTPPPSTEVWSGKETIFFFLVSIHARKFLNAANSTISVYLYD